MDGQTEYGLGVAAYALNVKPQLWHRYVGLSNSNSRPSGNRKITRTHIRIPRPPVAMPLQLGQDNFAMLFA
jgi:hypothetical protein